MSKNTKADPSTPVSYADFISAECDGIQKLLRMQAVSCRALGNSSEAEDSISERDFAAAFSGLDELLTAVGERIEAINDAATKLYGQYRALGAEKTGAAR